MKSLQNTIKESLRIGINDNPISYHPTTLQELYEIIDEKIDIAKDKLTHYHLDLTDIDVSNMTDLSGLFSPYDDFMADCKHKNPTDLYLLESLDVTGWDVSNVKEATDMCYDCTNLKTIIGIEDWDVSNLFDAREMFWGCKKLENINLNKWKIHPEAVRMQKMFRGCKKDITPDWYDIKENYRD